MQEAISVALLELATVAQRERFTGYGPFPVAEHRLGVVTGRLRRDLHAEPATKTSTGYTGRIGSPVEYFRAHEIGFDGDVTVHAHTRSAREVNRKAMERVSKKGTKFTIKANRFSLMEQSVRSFTRHMKVPARAPLATAIREHSNILTDSIRAVFAAGKPQSGGLA